MVQAWTIPKAVKCKKRRCDSPGPGNYKKVNMNLVKYAAPEWTIKGRYPYKLESYDCPGPGTYSMYMHRPGSAYSIQGKRQYYMSEGGLPGPGSYSIKS